ncbi:MULTISPECIES: DNA cytosine methyltransferase [unclassified Streptomyces]|uniref:DNA cytosine methyltransferase n=1 Tax=unclassified Streptomyces TaxID=2593676 RepID=UPI0003763357|nr:MULTISPECIES: DNA cytosine methyltransferase [unclassified Streptomyces]
MTTSTNKEDTLNAPRIGSLFTGTGALDLAVIDVFGGETVWHSQYEPPDKKGKPDTNQYAAKILARHWPDVPNLGDITAINWAAVRAEHGPINILTGGFPCQDVSSAGRRAGLTDDSRSGLWAHMARAITELEPELVVIENVEGLLSAKAAGDLEPCPYCVGDRHDQPLLRALGAVLGDLAVLGFDAEWARVAASEVGAAHGRKRVFIYAWPADADPPNLGHEWGRLARRRGHGPADSGLPPADTSRKRLEVGGVEPDGPEFAAAERGGGESAADSDGVESERRGVAGVLGSQAAAELGEGDQRERAGHTVGDSGEAAPDADGRGRERHQERDGGPEDGQPEREPRVDAVGRGVRREPVEPTCPTCGCEESFHGGGGFCASPCGGGCTDLELGRPADCPVCADKALADANSQRSGEKHPGADLIVGERAPQRRRSVEFAGLPRDREAGLGGAAEQSAPEREPTAEQQANRRTILNLRDGDPDIDWGDYEPAIRRWEAILGRRAPWTTDALGRLSPVFTEWLMGLPDGWVTCTPGLPRSAMLRALGNGVVRQQAVAALHLLASRATPTAAAA